jgi:hypothetical protein
MSSLIRHLHSFVREVELTEEEWMAGIQFLTATGKKCDEKRQEFILLVRYARRVHVGGCPEPSQARGRNGIDCAWTVLCLGRSGAPEWDEPGKWSPW